MKKLTLTTGLLNLSLFLTISILITSCQPDQISLENDLDTYLSNYEMVTLNSKKIFNEIKNQRGDIKQVNIPYNDLSFEVTEMNIFSDNLEHPFYVVEKDGSHTPAKMPEMYFLNNNDLNATDIVFMTLSEDQFRVEYQKEGKTYFIVPVTDFLGGQPGEDYVVHTQENIVVTAGDMNCFHQEIETVPSDGNITVEGTPRAGAYTLKVGGIIDFAMKNYYGQSNAIQQVLNQVAGANQVFINNRMSVDIVWGGGYIDANNTFNATTETYNSLNFWNQWVSWTNGAGSWTRASSVDNHFIWTGHWLQNTGGMGLTVVCNNPYYSCGFMNIRKANSGGTSWKNWTLAHEVGHSLGATHGSGLMAWNTASGYIYQATKNQINNHLSWYGNCLHD